MTYLYGDSTDSGLELNYIELLREFLDFAVQVMLSEHRIATARNGVDETKRNATAEIEKLKALGVEVGLTLEKARSGNPKSATEQSVQIIHKSTDDTLRRAAEGLKATVAKSEQALLATIGRERAGNAKLIEPLLLNHRLPDSESWVDIEIDAEGHAYTATVHGFSKQGLSWRFDSGIPAEHTFKEVIKIASIDPELTISLPEMSGFVRKSVKLKPYRVFPLYLTSLKHQGSEVIAQLRSNPALGDDTGLDIQLRPASPRVSITRLQKGEKSAPFDAAGEDAAKLIDLLEGFSKKSRDLVEKRSRLIDVRVDKQPLSSYAEPATLLTRLIQRIGPVVTKIAEHSLADTELVLKRVLANGRREEIFASKADMVSKISTVPAEARWVFIPLGLGNLETGDHDRQATHRVDRLAPVDGKPASPFDEEGNDEETKVPGAIADDEDTGISEVSEIIALAPDEEDDELTDLVEPSSLSASRARPSKAPPAPPGTKPVSARIPLHSNASSGPSGDSIDAALAELEADS